MISDELFEEFLNIVRALNKELNITPVLYGSLGLKQITGIDFSSQDIDVLIPLEFLNERWTDFHGVVTGLGYELVDLHEHEFRRNEFKIAFAFEEDLLLFAAVDYMSLKVTEGAGARYRQLSLEDFLRVYSESVTDGYRRTKKNKEDVDRISVIQRLLRN